MVDKQEIKIDEIYIDFSPADEGITWKRRKLEKIIQNTNIDTGFPQQRNDSTNISKAQISNAEIKEVENHVKKLREIINKLIEIKNKNEYSNQKALSFLKDSAEQHIKYLEDKDNVTISNYDIRNTKIKAIQLINDLDKKFLVYIKKQEDQQAKQKTTQIVITNKPNSQKKQAPQMPLPNFGVILDKFEKQQYNYKLEKKEENYSKTRNYNSSQKKKRANKATTDHFTIGDFIKLKKGFK